MAHYSDNYTQRRTLIKKGSAKWLAIREGYKQGTPVLELAHFYNVCDSTILRLTRDIRAERKAGKDALTKQAADARKGISNKKKPEGSGVIAGPTYHRGSRWWGGSVLGPTSEITEES